MVIVAAMRNGNLRLVSILFFGWLIWLVPAQAQELSALARLDPQGSTISQGRSGISIELALSQPVPWRVRVLDHPARLLIDFRDVDLAPIGQMARAAPDVVGVRAGQMRRGWSRLVLELGRPYLVRQSEMRTRDGTRLRIALARATPDAFAEKAALPEVLILVPSGMVSPRRS
jgi:N-acetylmuramoyl-L-alanine amidase